MYLRGFRIEVTNLRAVPIGAPPTASPILTIALLHARVPILNFFFHHALGTQVAAHGLVMDLSTATRQLLAQDAAATSGTSQTLPLKRLVVTDSTLKLEPTAPGKPPILIRCSRLVLDNLDAPTGPAAYTADLSSPIPGLHSDGHFGPLNLATPRDTPIDGAFNLRNTPLNLLPGVTGAVSSIGTLQGTLGRLTLAGSASSPNFALDVSAHPFPVAADYRAAFDLTSGDLSLTAVTARFLNTTVVASGAVDRQPDGRHISLTIRIRDGRNQDIITLLSRPPAPFTSSINLDARVAISPGAAPLILRVRATGTAALSGVLWTSPRLQNQMNSLSMRASDHADQAEDHPASIPLAYSNMTGAFTLSNANIAIADLVYTLPGAAILMQGTYPLIAPDLNFHGLIRTVATASHMETGIKSLLLMPISPFLKKNGAGMQLPISLTGNKADPDVSLDLSHLPQERAISRSSSRRPRL